MLKYIAIASLLNLSACAATAPKAAPEEQPVRLRSSKSVAAYDRKSDKLVPLDGATWEDVAYSLLASVKELEGQNMNLGQRLQATMASKLPAPPEAPKPPSHNTMPDPKIQQMPPPKVGLPEKKK